jgi:hypothetical protein
MPVHTRTTWQHILEDDSLHSPHHHTTNLIQPSLFNSTTNTTHYEAPYCVFFSVTHYFVCHRSKYSCHNFVLRYSPPMLFPQLFTNTPAIFLPYTYQDSYVYRTGKEYIYKFSFYILGTEWKGNTRFLHSRKNHANLVYSSWI